MQNQTTHHKGKQGRPAERQAGRQGRQNRGKADAPSNTEGYRHTCGETTGDKGRQDLGKWDTPSNTGTRVGRQWETWGDKASWRQIPSNTGTHVGRQWETMKRNRRQRETGRQEGRQWEAIGWTRGDNGRQVETRPRGSGQTIQHRLTCEETMGDKGRQRRREGGRTIQQRETRREMGDKGKQDLGKADTPSNTGRQGETRPREGGHTIQGWGTIQHRHTCGETRGDKTSGRRTHHPTQARISRETMGDNEEQDFGKVDHPTQAHMLGDNGGQLETMGDNGKQLETTGDKDRQEGRQRETRGDKTSGRRTHHPTQAHMWRDNGREWGTMGDNGRPGETPWKGGHTIQARETRREVGDNRGDKTLERRTRHPTQTHIVRRQWETRGDKTSRRRTHRPTQADKTRPHPTQAHMWGDNGRQKGKTRRRKGGRTIQHGHKCGETMGDNGLNGREGETRPREGGHTIQHRHTCGERMGNNGGRVGTWRPGRQDFKKAGTPSKKGKQEGRWEQWKTTRRDKTLGRRTHHPIKANKKGYSGRQRETRPSARRTHHPTRGTKADTLRKH